MRLPDSLRRFATTLAHPSTTLSMVVVALVAIAQLWPGLSHDLSPPISWDHGSHIAKAMQTWNELGTLRGWTDNVVVGVPLNTVYTPVGTLLILFVRLFTTSLEWPQTYAIAFALFRIIVGLSSFRLARAIGGGNLGGVVAGLLVLADQGDHSEGGWFYDVQFGVWPMSLAMCVFFLAVADLVELLDEHGARAFAEASRGKLARTALLFGIALFAHQASLFAIFTIVPSIMVVRATTPDAPLGRDIVRVVVVLGIAVFVACWWLLPMFSLTAYLDDHGQLYRGTIDMGQGLAEGRGILNGGVYTGVLVTLGILAALGGRWDRRALGVAALFAMMFGSPGWFLELDMARVLPPLGRFVFPRMMMMAKPPLFALAGCVVHDVWLRAQPELRRLAAHPRGRIGLVVGALMLVPFSPGFSPALHTLLLDRQVNTTNTMTEWQSWNDVWRWVRERPEHPFFRVLYINPHSHLELASGAFTGRPLLTTGIVVGEAFANTTDSSNPEALRALNVRYVASFSPLPYELDREVDHVETFGLIRVYQLRAARSDVVSALDGEARPNVTHYERERVVFEPRGAREIVVRRAYSPEWHAYADGAELPITFERVVDSPRLRLVRLSLPEGTREVVLRFRPGAPYYVGALLTLLGLLAIAFIAWGRDVRWPMAVRRIEQRVAGRLEILAARVPGSLRSSWPAWVMVAPFLAAPLVYARGLAGYHFARHLDAARVSVRRDDGPASACAATPQAPSQIVCPSLASAPIELTAECVDGRFHSCMRTHTPSGETLVLEWPHASLSGRLVLGGGVSDDTQGRQHGEPIRVRTFVDDVELGAPLEVPVARAWGEQMLDVTPGDHAVRFEVTGPGGRLPFCLDAISR